MIWYEGHWVGQDRKRESGLCGVGKRVWDRLGKIETAPLFIFFYFFIFFETAPLNSQIDWRGKKKAIGIVWDKDFWSNLITNWNQLYTYISKIYRTAIKLISILKCTKKILDCTNLYQLYQRYFSWYWHFNWYSK